MSPADFPWGEAAFQLASSFEENRAPHAVILEGEGREKLAEHLARAAVCTAADHRPCGLCAGCVKALAGNHPDILSAGGTGASRSFHVDEVRFIRSDAYIKPNEAPRKVYILREAQNMSEQAQNALLKVLEEPPENVLFLLTVPSAVALLSTVRSRSQLISLEITSATDWGELAAEIARAVATSGESAMLKATAPLIKDKEKLGAVLDNLALLFRDASILRAGGTSCLSGQREAAAALGAAMTRKRLLSLLAAVRETQAARERNANAALLVTALCARLKAADSDAAPYR